MRYIKLNPSKLSLSVTARPGQSAFTVPISDPNANRREARHPVSDAILYDVIYPARYAENRRKGINVKYSLYPPDPWLVGVGLVMWEGIVQGLSWDIVKGSVQIALRRMQRAKVAPREDSTLEKKGATELGFRYASYIKGEKQRELFVGLRRSYTKKATRKAANSAVHRTRAKSGARR